MKTFDVPDWMIAPFMANGVSEDDYSLYGAGSALGFVRTAAYSLGEPYSSQKVAEYHAYTGISAARTAIDATASWLEGMLEFQMARRYLVNPSRQEFRDKVSQVLPEISKYVENLGDLGNQIDDHRQQAQHREGLAIRNKSPRKSPHLNGWYLMPQGLSADHTADLRLVDLLNGWADAIEENLREIHKVLVMGSDDMQEAEQLLARLLNIRSSGDTRCE